MPDAVAQSVLPNGGTATVRCTLAEVMNDPEPSAVTLVSVRHVEIVAGSAHSTT